jgi:phosphotriesterase-related protein
MTVVNTVRGPVAATDLGRTLMHEHLVFGYPGYEGDRTMWSAEESTLLGNAAAAITAARASGFRTLFEVTPNDCGRNPVLLKKMAEENDFTVICATGYYYEGEGAPAYFGFRSLFADVVAELSELMITELTEGINGTGIKAGVIKLGTSLGEITGYEEMILKAAAKAQQATGAPIITHTQGGTMGPDQARILVEAGADPAKVVVGHMCGNAKDVDYQLATLAYGVGVGFDRIGLNKFFSDITDDDRMDTIRTLVDLGFHDRIFLSHDSVNNWLGRSVDGFYKMPGAEHWNISRIGEYIIPGLGDRGFSEPDIDHFLVDNIARLWS